MKIWDRWKIWDRPDPPPYRWGRIDTRYDTQAHLAPPIDLREPVEPEWHRLAEALAKGLLAGAFITMAVVYAPFGWVLIKDLTGYGEGGIFNQPNERVARMSVVLTLVMVGFGGLGMAAVGAAVKMLVELGKREREK